MKIPTAQDIFKNFNLLSAEFRGGFNTRVFGDEEYPYPFDGERLQGMYKANEMIAAGDIFSVHIFPHKNCTGHAFPYGCTFVCNQCGNSRLDKPWWTIKVYQDGNAWCCVGLGFVDLQSSSNYAFGETREQAIENYGHLFKELP